MVYEPREDSFLAVSFIKRYAIGPVLDLGCGSGILAKEAMKHSRNVLAADIDEKSVSYCKNQGINAVKSDLFSNIKGKFNLIIFNPPYLPEEKDEEKDIALAVSGGKKGNELIEMFLKDAKKHLNKNGKILLIVSSMAEDSEKLFKKYGYKSKMLKEEKFFFERLKLYVLSR